MQHSNQTKASGNNETLCSKSLPHIPGLLPRRISLQWKVSETVGPLTEFGRLVFNWKVLARCALVLAADEVRDLLVLSLLDGGLVVLRALAHELLLHEVDTCSSVSFRASWTCNDIVGAGEAVSSGTTSLCQGSPRSSRTRGHHLQLRS